MDAFLGLNRSHLDTKPVSHKRDQILCKRPACSGWTALLAHIQACFNIWLSYANPVVGVDDARRLDNVGPSGAPKCTTGLLRARDSGLMLQHQATILFH